MDIIAKADNRSFNMVVRKNVLILLRDEKHLSASADVIGVVIKIFISLPLLGRSRKLDEKDAKYSKMGKFHLIKHERNW